MLAKLFDNSDDGLGLKNWLELTESDTQYDALLTGLLKAVSRRFAKACKRTLERETRTRVFDGGSEVILVDLYPIEIATVVVKEAFDADFANAEPLVIQSDYFVYERSGIIARAAGIRWLSGRQTVQIAWSGGYVTPDLQAGTGQFALEEDVQEAVLKQCRYLWKRRNDLGIISTGTAGASWEVAAKEPWLADVDEVIRQYRKMG